MNTDKLQSFFGWCTVINFAALFVATLFIFGGQAFIYEVHQYFFPGTQDEMIKFFYYLIAGWKGLIFIFNFVPWVVLRYAMNNENIASDS